METAMSLIEMVADPPPSESKPIPQERLSYAYCSLSRLPRLTHVGLRSLDVSHNQLTSLRGLGACVHLQTLVADSNRLGGDLEMPFLPRLRYFSLNDNRVEAVQPLASNLRLACPALRWLSLVGNPVCPDTRRADSTVDWVEYRWALIAHLPALAIVDNARVSPKERSHAVLHMSRLGLSPDAPGHRARSPTSPTSPYSDPSPGHLEGSASTSTTTEGTPWQLLTDDEMSPPRTSFEPAERAAEARELVVRLRGDLRSAMSAKEAVEAELQALRERHPALLRSFAFPATHEFDENTYCRRCRSLKDVRMAAKQRWLRAELRRRSLRLGEEGPASPLQGGDLPLLFDDYEMEEDDGLVCVVPPWMVEERAFLQAEEILHRIRLEAQEANTWPGPPCPSYHMDD